MSTNNIAGPHVGLAAATSVAAALNAILLYRGLRSTGILQHSAGWPILLVRILVACIIMFTALDYLNRPIEWWVDATFIERVIWLAVSIVVGMGTYFLTMLLMGTRVAQFKLRAD
jgi:putative peptidoglycan lipid II flippase